MQKINRNKPSLETSRLTCSLFRLFNLVINAYLDPPKVTKVIELYKAKNRTQPANCRPISLLPITAKLLDTLFNANS